MQVIDNLDLIIQRNINWLRGNSTIKIYSSQKESLQYIVSYIVSKENISYHYHWIKPPFFNSVNHPINSFSYCILELGAWLMEHQGTDASKLKLRLSTLIELIKISETMTSDEEEKMQLEFQKREAAPIRKLLNENKNQKKRDELSKRLDEINREMKEAEAKLHALKSGDYREWFKFKLLYLVGK